MLILLLIKDCDLLLMPACSKRLDFQTFCGLSSHDGFLLVASAHIWPCVSSYGLDEISHSLQNETIFSHQLDKAVNCGEKVLIHRVQFLCTTWNTKIVFNLIYQTRVNTTDQYKLTHPGRGQRKMSSCRLTFA